MESGMKNIRWCKELIRRAMFFLTPVYVLTGLLREMGGLVLRGIKRFIELIVVDRETIAIRILTQRLGGPDDNGFLLCPLYC